MRCRRIPIQGIGERGDIIRMEKNILVNAVRKRAFREGTERYDQSPEPH